MLFYESVVKVMALPDEFKKENVNSIMIYHYVEELIGSYKTFMEQIYSDEEITLIESSFLIRIKFLGKCNQIDLVEIFHMSEGYVARILKKFDELNLIERREDPANRRKKIVTLTEKGDMKAEKILKQMNMWEENVMGSMNSHEREILKESLFKIVIQTEKF